jgi:hypothetical protein
MSTRYPRLAMIGFALAGALGLYMVLSIVVTDRHKKKK